MISTVFRRVVVAAAALTVMVGAWAQGDTSAPGLVDSPSGDATTGENAGVAPGEIEEGPGEGLFRADDVEGLPGEEGIFVESDEDRQRAEKLTPRQMMNQAEEAVNEMDLVLQDVLGILKNARSEKDVVKLNCTNDKLTQIKGLVRVSEQAYIALQEAEALDDIDSMRHEFVVIVIAGERVVMLRAEAEECIGQLAWYMDDDMTVEVEVPDDLPDDDLGIDAPPPVLVRPAPLSPTGPG